MNAENDQPFEIVVKEIVVIYILIGYIDSDNVDGNSVMV